MPLSRMPPQLPSPQLTTGRHDRLKTELWGCRRATTSPPDQRISQLPSRAPGPPRLAAQLLFELHPSGKPQIPNKIVSKKMAAMQRRQHRYGQPMFSRNAVAQRRGQRPAVAVIAVDKQSIARYSRFT
jgi:hypothetical protein